jgi:ribonuclease HIII
VKKPHVLLVTSEQATKIRALLTQLGATFGKPPHTHFDASVEGARITCYTSGKLLFQGAAAETWIEKLGPLLDLPPQDEPDERAELAIATIGSDESGKGDYFGSLVVAACMLRPKDVRIVRELGVRDSKEATDSVIRAAAAQLEATVPCAIDELSPEAYNARHAEVGNVNIMLGDAHARVICDLANRTGARDVVVDRFAAEHYVRGGLGALACEIRMTMVPRAESNPAVAAASFLARARFVQSLERLSEEVGMKLLPGASFLVERRARELVARCGRRALDKVAKIHFKTTLKVI